MIAPAIRECMDFAVANGEGLDTCNAAALQLRELLRRDWAVRVLDAWAQAGSSSQTGRLHLSRDTERGLLGGFSCDLHGCAKGPFIQSFRATSPDAARLAAAEALWPELPADVRAELGERP